MFGKAYVVDVVSDQGQHFDSGVLASREEADKVLGQIENDEWVIRPLPGQFTVRLICNGEVLRQVIITSQRRG